MNALRRILQILMPVVILAAAAVLARAIVSMRPEVEVEPHVLQPPLVSTVAVSAQSWRVAVEAQGVVQPRTESSLAAELAGRVEEVSPSLVDGGFFEEGEVLLRIEDDDYRLAVEEARLGVARAQRLLVQEEADASAAVQDWELLGRGEPTPLVLRQPQLAEARAELAAARARLAMAERDVERCVLRAPYRGRVRDKMVDAGQFVARGQSLARVYAVDYAEVRLPVADAELAFLDDEISFPGDSENGNGNGDGDAPTVTLSAEFGGREATWSGRIVRTEGELDPRSRMVVLVARVEDPYARGEVVERPPLAVGMFVKATIQGREFEGCAVLPRSVLRRQDTIYVVGPDDRLEFRRVNVLRADRQRLVVSEGLSSGERVVTSPLEIATDGMLLRPVAEEDGTTGRNEP